MKTRFAFLKSFAVLCGIFAATAVFGQATYTWTGAGDGSNWCNPANWSTSGVTNLGVPNGHDGTDTAQWDNQAPGNLIIDVLTCLTCGVPCANLYGINLALTPNQVGNVSIVPVGITPPLGLYDIIVLSASAGFSLGDANDTSNIFNIDSRPTGATHNWLNNSANAAVIYPNVRWGAGGGAVYTLLFDGTGNWCVTNSLFNANGAGILISKQGPGTLFWNGPSVPAALGNSTIDSPITINDGTVVLQWNNPLINNDAITNSGLLQFNAPSQSQSLNGVISGSGALQVINGTLTLAATNTYTGLTTVSNGILLVNGQLDLGGVDVEGGALGGAGTILGPVTIQNGGTLAAGAPGGSLAIDNDLAIGGNLAFAVDKSLSPSLDLVVVSGVLTNSGAGTLTVSNLGPALAPGDSFTLFSQPVANGAALTVTGAGANWANDLAVDGSISVSSRITPPLITSVQSLDGNIVIAGTSGNEPGTWFYTLASTNLALPLSNWTIVATNQLGAGGGFIFTNNIDSNTPQQFFILGLH